MSNRLVNESSLYLRQHMDDPVDWFPWGKEALELAKAQNKPILLSIGYSACHWCHVMARESFEDREVAELMNRHFVSIKVDREERPDLDHIYMTACQVFTGSGGWPLTVFLTPQLLPFFAGTYFPREDRFGRPGFKRVLQSLARVCQEHPGDVQEQAQRFSTVLQQLSAAPEQQSSSGSLDANTLLQAADGLVRQVDPVNGGFGGAPKFPNTLELMVLEMAARRGHARAGQASLLTCRKMLEGGIHDHLGGGFHRYSTDARWLVPHFEKMLYDNALIPRVLLSAYRRTGHAWLRAAVEDTLAYVQREMTAPSGAFYSTQDADSEGQEGRFFCWNQHQIQEVLGPRRARLFCLRHGVDDGGTFEHGLSVLHHAVPLDRLAQSAGMPEDALAAELDECRVILFAAREQRKKPARDEKIITGWNGLMVSALCDAASTLEEPGYLQMATRALDFLLHHARTEAGGLMRVHAAGVRRIPAFLEDYAFLALAACDTHRAGGGGAYLAAAGELCEQILVRFLDTENTGFFTTEQGAPDTIVRPRADHDEAVPSGGWAAARALLYVGTATGNTQYVRLVEDLLRSHASEIRERPGPHASALLVLDQVVAGPPCVVVAGQGEAAEAMRQRVRVTADPVVMVLDAQEEGLSPALVQGKHTVGGTAAAYICTGNVCSPVAMRLESLDQGLKAAGLAANLQTSPHMG